jgi:hypothetical protein
MPVKKDLILVDLMDARLYASSCGNVGNIGVLSVE